MQITMRQQLALLLIAAMAVQISQAWLFKLPKLEDLAEKLEGKEHKEALKKLDIFNLFTDKEEKKESELDKIKQWFEDKKLKELDFFADKKEKKIEKLEEKLVKKTKAKKVKKPRPYTTTECYYSDSYTTQPPSYGEHSYEEKSYKPYDDDEEVGDKYEEEEEEEIVPPKKVYEEKPCDCKPNKGYSAYQGYAPSAYDVREDYEAGVRYFT